MKWLEKSKREGVNWDELAYCRKKSHWATGDKSKLNSGKCSKERNTQSIVVRNTMLPHKKNQKRLFLPSPSSRGEQGRKK